MSGLLKVVSFFIIVNLTLGCSKGSKGLDATHSDKQESAKGTDVGNGGGSVVCSNKSGGQRVYFYDYYEAFSKNYPFDLTESIFSPKAKSVVSPDFLFDFKEIVRLIIYNLGNIDKKTSTFLDFEFQNFKDNSIWLLPSEGRTTSLFYQTKDLYSEINLPENCEFKQMIVQYKSQGLSDMATYYVDQALFNKMDTVNQAVAVVHELIYSLFLRNGLDGDSRPVRELTRILFELPTLLVWDENTKNLKASFRLYAMFMQEKGVSSISGAFLGQIVQLNLGEEKIKFCANNNIKSADVEEVRIKIRGNPDLVVTGKTDFYCSSGVVKKVELSLYDNPVKVFIGGKKLMCEVLIEFNEDGSVRACK